MHRPFPAYKGSEPYTFVCYSHADKELVYRELSWLNETGFRLWYDEGINPGHEWNEDLAKAIRFSTSFLYFVTPDSERSQYCRREVGFALELEKPIVSVHLKPTTMSDGLRLSLGSIQGILRYEFQPDHYKRKLAEVLTPQLTVGDSNTSTEIPAEDILSVPANSIAVLPFTNISRQQEDQVFSDGLAEEILNLLARLSELKVASSTSCYFYKDKQLEVQTIGHQLRVRYVMEGTVRRAGENMRITLRLIDTETGFQVLSEKYDCVMTNIFEVQDRISAQIVDALKIVLSPDSKQRLKDATTTDSQAYELYLKGKSYLRETSDQEVVGKAQRCFEQAIQIDSRYARAYAGLCETYLIQYDNVRSGDFFDLARKASEKSIELDPFSLDARLSLGKLYNESGRHDEALVELESALELDPDNVDTKSELVRVLMSLERVDEAKRLIHDVIAQQPDFWKGHLLLANYHFNRGEYEFSLTPLEKVMEMNPENGTVSNNLGSSNYMLGNFEEAAKAWEKSVQISPSVASYSNLGTMHFFARRFEAASHMYQKCIELAPEDHRGWGSLADAYRFIDGFSEKSITAYTKALSLAEAEMERNPNDEETLAIHGHYLANLGFTDRAKKAVSIALDKFGGNSSSTYYAAVVYTLLELPELALQSIKSAVEQGYPKAMVKADAQFDSLLNEKAFVEFIDSK